MSLAVGAARGDRAPAQEDDVVGLVEDERARGHDDRRASGAGRGEAPGDAGLGVRVDGARRLDEHEGVRLGQEGARQGEPLALAAGEGPAPLLDLVVETAGQRLEHVVAARDREGLEDGRVVVVAPRVEARRAACR